MLFSVLFTFGQHEYTYYNKDVQRIVLENSGEKYFSYSQTGVIQLFNANHTLWKTINITLPSGNYSFFVSHISETLINPDANLEIIYGTYSAPGIRRSKIINEIGTELLSEENCLRFLVDKKDELESKIISSTGIIYSLPSLAIEHIYPSINYANVTRVKLENSGEKYYYLDRTNGLAVLYNADHTFWKNIVLPKPDGFTISNIDLLSENQLNSDNLIEVGYSCNSDIQSESRIANENGETLLIATNPGIFAVSAIDGLPNKLMVYYMPGDMPDETSRRTDVYAISTFNLEHTYQQYVSRIELENSGEKYHAKFYDYLTSDITIYNSDHSLWKTVSTPAINGQTIENVFISETKFNSDSQLEVMFTISSNTLDGGHYLGSIVKEDGTVIGNFSGAYNMYLSELPNLQTKLMVYTQFGPSFDQLYYSTDVYRLQETFAVEDFNNESISITPNPAISEINFTTNNTIVEASICSITGELLQFNASNAITKMNVQQLQTGIYFLHLVDSNHIQSTKKIIISH